MGALIDSSVLIGLERGSVPVERVAEHAPASISVVTASELLHGVHRAADAAVRDRRLAFVERVLARFAPLDATTAVARVHAEIWASTVRAGTPVGAQDLWIAATALVHGLDVVTVNAKDFRRVAGLGVVDVG